MNHTQQTKQHLTTLLALFFVMMIAACSTRQKPERAYSMKPTSAPRMMKKEMGYDAAPPRQSNPMLIQTEEKIAIPEQSNSEEYNKIDENPFLSAKEKPLSTLSIDVDVAAYANVRRFINQGRMPYVDAVRIEEMINYFNYEYKNPTGEHPFSINSEVGECPWNDDHYLVHVGLQGEKMANEDLPPSNLVFLFDVSGSMNAPNKLPLLKSAFKLLVNQLGDKDRVAIAVYAGAAGLVLPSTPASDQNTILNALNSLEAGGSTAGGAGIKLAYKTALDNFIEGGNNRVIIATDGDFNVGLSSDSELVRMIEEKRENDVFLSVLGFGTGNYKDSKMEQLADKGNGNYAYIDNIQEAKKVLVSEMGGTLYTIAKDVKIQVEFNPNIIKGYRLIGYENRVMAAEDFDDDTKDAGELGAGHTVTALYEIVPMGADTEIRSAGKLKYQMTVPVNSASNELMTVKFRYKKPDGDVSQLLEQPILDKAYALENTSDDFRFSASVASFGMILRKSKFKGNSNYGLVQDLAIGGKGYDLNGYRKEFIELVKKAEKLDKDFGKENVAEE